MTTPKKESKVKAFIVDSFMGGTAGAISKTVSAPLERVKLLLQTQDANLSLKGQKYTGFINCMTRVYQEEGFLSYWRGNWANVVRYFPTTALNFGFKGFFNGLFNKWDPKKDPVKFAVGNVLAGGSAGAACMMFVYPLDFARTRMGVDTGKTVEERQFRSLSDCLRKIYRSDGVGGLYSGIQISLISIFIYRGLYFGGYDSGKKLFPVADCDAELREVSHGHEVFVRTAGHQLLGNPQLPLRHCSEETHDELRPRHSHLQKHHGLLQVASRHAGRSLAKRDQLHSLKATCRT